MTKREFLKAVASNEITDEIISFAVKEIENMDKKNEKDRMRKTKTQIANEALIEKLCELITSEPITIQEMIEQLGDPNLTNQKISSLMRKVLEQNSGIEKVKIKVDKREKVAYQLVASEN